LNFSFLASGLYLTQFFTSIRESFSPSPLPLVHVRQSVPPADPKLGTDQWHGAARGFVRVGLGSARVSCGGEHNARARLRAGCGLGPERGRGAGLGRRRAAIRGRSEVRGGGQARRTIASPRSRRATVKRSRPGRVTLSCGISWQQQLRQCDMWSRNSLSLSTWDVGKFGAGTQKLESLSGLDAGGTACVPRARNRVVLTAASSRCRSRPPRFPSLTKSSISHGDMFQPK
jgi:hypothetical protein